MIPPFEIEGGLPLALTRAAFVAALLGTLGTLAFRAYVFRRAFAGQPPDAKLPIERQLVRLARASLAAAFVAGSLWLALQSADMASATSVQAAIAAIPDVVEATAFGHLIVPQLFLIAVIALTLGRAENPRRRIAALCLTVLAVALHAGHSHAASMYGGPSFLLLADILHLLAAGVWLGGLIPLLLTVRDAPPKLGALAARWFSPMGKLCLYVLAGTAAFQGWVMIGTVPGLVGTGYGWMALVKLALFGVLFGFAWINRYRFAPALLGADPRGARRKLVASIAAQTCFGLAIVVAAAVLSGMAPAMHVQPLWPFADRFSLATVDEDPDFKREAMLAVAAMATAMLLLAVAVLLRRKVVFAGLALAASAGIAWLAAPHLDLLFVPAYPTSFYHSPTGFAATSIVQGKAIFAANCVACHGAQGRGDGPLAKTLPVPPADLTAEHLWMHEDGELFWWLAHGMEAPDGQTAMPGFEAILSDDERWEAIDYIRAHNAGLFFQAHGDFSPPIEAPGLQANCAGGRAVSLADFRGDFVRLVFGPTGKPATLIPANAAAPRNCVADDDASPPRAYAIVAGLPIEKIPGAEFLIDPDGFLRAVRPAGAPAPGWDDPATLAAKMRELAEHPIAARANQMNMPM